MKRFGSSGVSPARSVFKFMSQFLTRRLSSLLFSPGQPLTVLCFIHLEFQVRNILHCVFYSSRRNCSSLEKWRKMAVDLGPYWPVAGSRETQATVYTYTYTFQQSLIAGSIFFPSCIFITIVVTIGQKIKTSFAAFITYKQYYLFSLYLIRWIEFMFAANKIVTIATFSAVFVVIACANKTSRSFQVLKNGS